MSEGTMGSHRAIGLELVKVLTRRTLSRCLEVLAA